MLKPKLDNLKVMNVTAREFSLLLYGVVSPEVYFNATQKNKSRNETNNILDACVLIAENSDESTKARIVDCKAVESHLIQEFPKFPQSIFSSRKSEAGETKFRKLGKIEELQGETKDSKQVIEMNGNEGAGLYEVIEQYVYVWEEHKCQFATLLDLITSDFDIDDNTFAPWVQELLNGKQNNTPVEEKERAEKMINVTSLPAPLQLFIECCNFKHLTKENLPHTDTKDYSKKLADEVRPYAKKYGITHLANSKTKEGISPNHAHALGFIINYQE